MIEVAALRGTRWVKSASDLDDLPAPVARYFARSLRSEPEMIRSARVAQRGALRLKPQSSRWLPFDAFYLVHPLTTKFEWNARVVVFAGLRMRVLDALAASHGSGKVSFLSGVVVLFVQIGAFSSETQHPCGFAASAGRSNAGPEASRPSEAVH